MQNLGWVVLRIPPLNSQLLVIEMFKVVTGIAPKIMADLFLFNHSTRNNNRFIRPSVNSVWNGKNSVRYFGPVVWDDMVPAKLKSIQTLEKFKEEAKKWGTNVNSPFGVRSKATCQVRTKNLYT